MIAITCVPVQRIQCEATAGTEQITFGPVGDIEPNVSPDGRWLAFQHFVANQPGLVQIWIMELSKGFRSARRLVCNFDYAGEMSWSPDSKWISFITRGNEPGRSTDQIYKINITTNETVRITNFPEGTVIGDSTTWSTSGLIGFARDGIIYCVPPAGGKEVQVLDTRTILSDREPYSIRFSPDGKMLLFSVENTEQDQSSIWVADLESKSVRRLTDHYLDLSPTWIDEGHVLFMRMEKKKWAEVEALSLSTGNLKQLTSKHIDFTPSTDPSGNVLYFSRKGKVPKNLEKGDFFAGYHIWRMPIPGKLLK